MDFKDEDENKEEESDNDDDDDDVDENGGSIEVGSAGIARLTAPEATSTHAERKT